MTADPARIPWLSAEALTDAEDPPPHGIWRRADLFASPPPPDLGITPARPKHRRDPATIAARDKALCAAFRSGTDVATLAATYDIAVAHVGVILRAHGIVRRKAATRAARMARADRGT